MFITTNCGVYIYSVKSVMLDKLLDEIEDLTAPVSTVPVIAITLSLLGLSSPLTAVAETV